MMNDEERLDAPLEGSLLSTWADWVISSYDLIMVATFSSHFSVSRRHISLFLVLLNHYYLFRLFSPRPLHPPPPPPLPLNNQHRHSRITQHSHDRKRPSRPNSIQNRLHNSHTPRRHQAPRNTHRRTRTRRVLRKHIHNQRITNIKDPRHRKPNHKLQHDRRRNMYVLLYAPAVA